MIVSEAQVHLGSSYERHESLKIRESLTLHTVPVAASEQVQLSEEAKAAEAAERIRQAQEDAANDPRVRLIVALLEAFTGRTLAPRGAPESAPEAKGKETTPVTDTPEPGNLVIGFRYDFEAEHRLTEAVRFDAEALVRTADGKEIHVEVGFALDREAVTRLGLSVQHGHQPRPKDPLVLNFAGTSAELAEGRFLFDLDSDGKAEAMPFLAAGSAYLALDRNGDQQINDGRELFGPTTGDGFAELGQWDADKNGVIDEADPVFDRLKLFNRTAQGDLLVSLRDAGVGAIFLNPVTTPFELSAGYLRNSGLFLTEAGHAGIVQHVDLKV